MTLRVPDDDGLVSFCELEHPRLVGALSLYTGDAVVAEDLAQEALIRVMDTWPKVREMQAPGAWAHRVAMNLAKSWFRRKAAERRALSRLGDPDPVEGEEASVVAVRAAVAGLPDRQRRCLVLRHYLGYPVDVTADTLGISEQAVASLTYRAMQALRRQLGDDPVAEEVRDVG